VQPERDHDNRQRREEPDQQLGAQAPAGSRYSAPGNDLVKNLSFSVYPLADGLQVSQPPPQGITTTVIAARDSVMTRC